MVGTCDFCRNEKPLFPWLRARKCERAAVSAPGGGLAFYRS